MTKQVQVKARFFKCGGASRVIETIAKNDQKMKKAFLDLYPLDESQVKNLASAVRENTNLEYLNLFDCDMTTEQHQMIIGALNDNGSINRIIINRDIGKDLYEQYQAAVNVKPPACEM